MPGLLLRVDLFAIEENAEGSRAAGTQPSGDAEFSFDLVLEAHGLGFDISSKKAAFNFDGHDSFDPENDLKNPRKTAAVSNAPPPPLRS